MKKRGHYREDGYLSLPLLGKYRNGKSNPTSFEGRLLFLLTSFGIQKMLTVEFKLKTGKKEPGDLTRFFNIVNK